ATRIVGRVVALGDASAPQPYIQVVIQGVEGTLGELEPFDARILSVQTTDPSLGTVLRPEDVHLDASGDPLGRATVLSLGGAAPAPQLDPGTRLVFGVRGSMPQLGDRQPVAGRAEIRDLGAIGAGATSLVGRRVELAGVTVDSVASPVLFWVGSDGK